MGSLTTLTTELKDGWTIGNMLSRQAVERPDAPAVQWQTEEPLSYQELYECCLRVAGGLRALGVEVGDTVLIMLPNSLEIVLSWFGTNLLGAAEVPINIHYKESWLTHEVNDCGARVAIVHAEYLPRFAKISDDLEQLEKLVVVGDCPETDRNLGSKLEVHLWEDLGGTEALSEPARTRFYDTMGILYTSGTTGPSKGVVLPYGVSGIFAQAILDNAQLTSDDVGYVCNPLFHGNAQFMQVLPILLAGGRVSIWPKFTVSGWLEQIRVCGATITNTIGVILQFIYGQPARDDDADNPLRRVLVQPAPSDIVEDFEERFGVKCLEGYGMTEIGVVTYRNMDDPLRPGAAGKPLEKWFDVRIEDPETGEPLGPNELGAIVVRPKSSGILMKGYHNLPQKTLEAWRDLWFHTDDMARMDEEGYLYFADRAKDVIRRRGENISSFTIESILNTHPAVKEAAAFAVPSDLGEGSEDEVKVCIVLEGEEKLDPAELHEYCADRMPYFAVPRYIEFVPEIPKTPNQKVRKSVLREQGITAGTWDREAAGIRVRK
ncbi:Acyl-CoA synthetases (AMP-forming)/AMP-acid ligases II [Rubrobacter radiotolerans]|uniref:AMP-binding protein n=1 Tax=Rubrobacter radiotolerans TaxID=42256 RepID=A0A023X6P7_RUBRA|nr:AMP-binding protein [Rubrobacter radiotolerans]AHY47896.1 Acyl-CoA synthetases (AMP-forming)/AMP-acid ligases II [Rubrobacter radiotolerans]MDX5892535.1 AMP-binding protein [Rubrobacter radiotolerans]SMC07826.1 crotonobetaine/carnitine-CoA ligase [Rubrobacter radiotolerans DSM 5868]